MKGADEYYDLFNGKSQVIGRLFLQFHKHARGKCFEMFVIPEGGEPNIYGHAPFGSVEVYGMTGGQRGWTETYGWLHKGKWQDDFKALVSDRYAGLEVAKADIAKAENRNETATQKRVSGILATY
jgi:hypothetical protein